MAIVELVKNAYDAGATCVRILIQPETSREPGSIRMGDNGVGMNEADVKGLFMFAGYSQRLSQVEVGGRIATGEKGIGRFAADKLGQTLDVYSTKKGPRGIHLSIDWRSFDSSSKKKFSDVKAEYEVIDVSNFVRGARGTLLSIGHLRAKWDADKSKRLLNWLGDLLNPFSPPRDFVIELEVVGARQGTVVVGSTPPSGDVSLDLRVKKGRIVARISESGGRTRAAFERVPTVADLRQLEGLRARFIHFDKKPSKDRTHGLAPGVRVYRDGFRIEPFGSRDSDWLGVAEQRAKRAGHAHVVPNRLFGFVEISRISNPELQDTTSRQAILDSRAAQGLVTLLRESVGALAEVLKERTEPRWEENKRQKAAQLEQARLFTLGEVASGLAHELRQPLQAIRSEADNIIEKLRSLDIVDDDIAEAQRAIDRGIVRIDKNISLVSSLSKGEFSDIAEFDLAKSLANEVEVFSNLCSPKGILIELNAEKSLIATTSESAITTIVANLLNNAIQAAESAGGSRISVSLARHRRRLVIEVRDDGGGVPDKIIPHLFTKFATQKTGGMGFGLYYCRMLIESLGGKIGHHAERGGARFWIEVPEG